MNAHCRAPRLSGASLPPFRAGHRKSRDLGHSTPGVVVEAGGAAVRPPRPWPRETSDGHHAATTTTNATAPLSATPATHRPAPGVPAVVAACAARPATFVRRRRNSAASAFAAPSTSIAASSGPCPPLPVAPPPPPSGGSRPRHPMNTVPAHGLRYPRRVSSASPAGPLLGGRPSTPAARAQAALAFDKLQAMERPSTASQHASLAARCCSNSSAPSPRLAVNPPLPLVPQRACVQLSPLHDHQVLAREAGIRRNGCSGGWPLTLKHSHTA